MHARRWCLGWVLIALVCAQALGFMHRAVHATRTVPAAIEAHAHAGVPQVQAAAQADASWVGTLFAAHDVPGCRVLDALGHCGLPLAAALPLLPVLSAGLGLLPLTAEFIGSPLAPFQARGPPSSR